jgi:hypothetical protein
MLDLERKIKKKSIIYYLCYIYFTFLKCAQSFEKTLKEETICEI